MGIKFMVPFFSQDRKNLRRNMCEDNDKQNYHYVEHNSINHIPTSLPNNRAKVKGCYA
jgi:hypothetical protein